MWAQTVGEHMGGNACHHTWASALSVNVPWCRPGFTLFLKNQAKFHYLKDFRYYVNPGLEHRRGNKCHHTWTLALRMGRHVSVKVPWCSEWWVLIRCSHLHDSHWCNPNTPVHLSAVPITVIIRVMVQTHLVSNTEDSLTGAPQGSGVLSHDTV